MRSFGLITLLAGAVSAACPYMSGDVEARAPPHGPDRVRRHVVSSDPNGDFLAQFELDDADSYMTSDVGGRIADQDSLKAGERGPTLLEDFIFRQKIQHFDHERVSARHHHIDENDLLSLTVTDQDCLGP
jgi:catalase